MSDSSVNTWFHGRGILQASLAVCHISFGCARLTMWLVSVVALRRSTRSTSFLRQTTSAIMLLDYDSLTLRFPGVCLYDVSPLR